MALVIAALLLTVFVVNVAMGSVAGQPPLGNVSEMLILLAASIAFVVAILRREAQAKALSHEMQAADARREAQAVARGTAPKR